MHKNDDDHLKNYESDENNSEKQNLHPELLKTQLNFGPYYLCTLIILYGLFLNALLALMQQVICPVTKVIK